MLERRRCGGHLEPAVEQRDVRIRGEHGAGARAEREQRAVFVLKVHDAFA